MRTPVPVSFTLFLILRFTAAVVAQNEGDYRAAASGNWSTLSVWQRFEWVEGSGQYEYVAATTRPGEAETTPNVYIPDGVNLILDETPAYPVSSIFIGESTGGSLTLSSSASRELTINGDLVLTEGSLFQVADGSAGVVHKVYLKGDLLNDGSFTTKANSPFCIVKLSGVINQNIGYVVLSGITSFHVIEVDNNSNAGVVLLSSVLIDTMYVGKSIKRSLFNDNGKTIESAKYCLLSDSSKYICSSNSLQWVSFGATYGIGTTVSYISNFDQTIAALTYSTLQVTAGGGRKVIINQGDTVKILSSFISGSNNYTSIGATLKFEGGSQNLPIIDYPNLVISGTGQKNISDAIKVNGNLTIQSNVTLNPNSKTITVKGNWSNSGSFTAGTGTVVFSNTDSVCISSGGKAFYNLTTNGAGAVSLINHDLSVTGTFSKSAGKFYANGRKFNVKTLTMTGGSITGSTDSLIVTNLNLNGGSLYAPSGVFAVKGNWSNNGSGTFLPGSHTVYFVADTGTQNLNAGNQAFYQLVHSGSGTLKLTASLSLNKDLINSGGTLDANSYHISLKGNWVNTATFLPRTGKVSMSGNDPQTMGRGRFYDLEINNPSGVTLTAPDTVTHQLFPTAGTLATGGYLLLRSDTSGTAHVATLGATAAISGTAVCERYVGTVKRAWRLMSLPVTGTSIRNAWAGVPANGNAPAGEAAGSGTLITGHGFASGSSATAAGFDWFPGLGTDTRSSIRYYANDNWASATNTPDILSPPDKQGYMLFIRGDRTVASTAGSGITTLKPNGSLITGTQHIPITQPYELVGNPYAATVSIDFIYLNSGNSSVITRNFWIWDPAMGTYGGYRAISYANGQYAITGGGIDTSYLYLRSGQAFFVQKNGSGGDLIIEENDKVCITGTPLFHKSPQSGRVTSSPSNEGSRRLLYVNLYPSGGPLADGVVVRYGEGYLRSAHEVFDVHKLNNFNENLALFRDRRYLSMESLPLPVAGDTLYIRIWNLEKRTYQFHVLAEGFSPGSSVAYLHDAWTKTQTMLPLNPGGTHYDFTVDGDTASGALDRFYITWESAEALPFFHWDAAAHTVSGGILLAWKLPALVPLRDIEVAKSADGRVFRTVHPAAFPNLNYKGEYEWLDSDPIPGWNYYRIRGVHSGTALRYSPVIRAWWKRPQGMALFPPQSPQGSPLLQLKDPVAGTVSVSMYTISGQLRHTRSWFHPGGLNVYPLYFPGPASLPVAGPCLVVVTASSGLKGTFRLLIH